MSRDDIDTATPDNNNNNNPVILNLFIRNIHEDFEFERKTEITEVSTLFTNILLLFTLKLFLVKKKR